MKKLASIVLGLSFVLTAALQAHSEAFKPNFVDTLVDPYLAIQKGLADDNLKAAQTGANSFLEAMKQAPLQGEAHEEAADLTTPAKAIVGASDIKAARTAFLGLSQEMTSLVKHVGTTKDTPLFVAYCPMAFGNKGGSWMQSSKTVANPYYGSTMLGCGSIKEQVAGEKSDSDNSHGHDDHADGHQH